MKSFPVKSPQVVKKMNRARAARRAEVKSIVKQLGGIAKNEIDRLTEFADTVMTEEEDNPIVMVEEEED